MSLRDDWCEVVLDFHEQGLSRAEITGQVPMSSAYVSQIVAEAGRSFPEQTETATQARIVKQAERRLAEAEVLADLMARALAANRPDDAASFSAALSKLAV